MIKVIESTFSDVVSLPKLWQVYGFFQVIEKKLYRNIVSDRLSLSTADIFTVAAVSVATRAVDLDI